MTLHLKRPFAEVCGFPIAHYEVKRGKNKGFYVVQKFSTEWESEKVFDQLIDDAANSEEI